MNAPTLIIFLVVLAFIAADIAKIVWDRKHGKRSCGGNCESCAGCTGGGCSCGRTSPSSKHKCKKA